MAKIIAFAFCFYIFSPLSAFAQTTLNPDRDEPLEITADESLAWHRNELYFQAVKNVHAVQGSTTLVSDVLLAKYRDGAEGGIDIYVVRAEGHVQIISAKSKAYGDKAIYSVDKGYAIMTGKDLRLVSDDQIVTARDSFKYWVNDGRLEATGKAVAVRAGDKIEANKIIAIFTEDRSGKRVLKTMEAIGNVVITTQSEILTGGRAIYNAATNIAELHENVKIMRGQNVLEGRVATVNLNTNISKIVGGATDTGRVRGVFYPGAAKSDD